MVEIPGLEQQQKTKIIEGVLARVGKKMDEKHTASLCATKRVRSLITTVCRATRENEREREREEREFDMPVMQHHVLDDRAQESERK